MAGEGIGEAAGEAGEGIIGPISPIGAAGFAFSVGMGIYSQN